MQTKFGCSVLFITVALVVSVGRANPGTSGTGPEGETLRPPMHIYHMNQPDAKAIIAYLRSLQQSPH